MTYLQQFLEWMKTQDKEVLFKDVMGRYRTQSLFYEFNSLSPDQKDSPVFTTKMRHHGEYWSFPLLYLEIADLTEYEFSRLVLCDYEHFKKLTRAKIFRPMITQCRDELERKLRAQALETIRKIANSPEAPGSLAAAKYLANREWLDKATRKAKDALIREEKFKEEVKQEFDEDYKLLEGTDGEQAATN